MTRFFLILIWSAILSLNGWSDESLYPVREVKVMGNTRTLEEVITTNCGIRVGDSVSLSQLRRCREQLKALGIFRQVDVIPRHAPDGVYVDIVVLEGLNIIPIFSPHRYTTKYGKSETWYSLSTKLVWKHFRGRRESFWLATEGWDKKAVGLGWEQPFDSEISPYTKWIQGFYSTWPDLHQAYDARQVYGEAGIGRRIPFRLTPYIRLGLYNVYTDSAGTPPREFFYPKIGMGCMYDSRPRHFPRRKGRYAGVSVDQYGGKGGWNVDFPQVTFLAHSYHPLPLGSHHLVGILWSKLRMRRPPFFFRYYTGGKPLTRGYQSGDIQGENALSAALEYRVPIWKTFTLQIPYFDLYMPGLNDMYGILDLALFVDAGKYWDVDASFSDNPYYAGAGLGLRGWLPTIFRSGVLDFAWNQAGEFRYHLYLDIAF